MPHGPSDDLGDDASAARNADAANPASRDGEENETRRDRLAKNFTLVFAGNIRDFKMNPLTTETPWGVPHSVCVGDALEELDELRDRLAQTEGK